MWSKVDYDPKLTDPFFESNKRSYPDHDAKGTPLEKRPKKRPGFKQTAKCFSNSFEGGGQHLVNSCEAKVLDTNMVDLFIHESNPADHDRLMVRVRNGMFTCQFWTLFRRPATMRQAATWTTKQQKLTLTKKSYRKGDVIKGKIDFECVQQITDPVLMEHYGRDPTTIKVHGAFNTIVQ